MTPSPTWEELTILEPPRYPVFETLFRTIEPTAEPFEVPITDVEALRFNPVCSRKSLVSIRNAAHRFADSLSEANCPGPLRPYWTSDRETLIWVYFLGRLCMDGSEAEFLRLQHVCPVLFEQVLSQVQARISGNLEETGRLAVDAAKKDSAPVQTGASD
ncbi:MAG: hypothetical protein P4L46_17495 [Fimbriimonas sp.]|nr:hypothetical protein [Fimbriimonas sp.]